MISPFRLQANRRNALRSTGPKTDEGKQQSRANAFRHGLTAETIVASLEDAEDYKAFEAVIISDYCAETAVARELVLRLASILWRLRRATAIETDFLELQAGPSRNCLSREDPSTMTGSGRDACVTPTQGQYTTSECERFEDAAFPKRIRRLTHSFMRIASSETGAFECLNRYEARLWRQAVQIIFTLHPI